MPPEKTEKCTAPGERKQKNQQRMPPLLHDIQTDETIRLPLWGRQVDYAASPAPSARELSSVCETEGENQTLRHKLGRYALLSPSGKTCGFATSLAEGGKWTTQHLWLPLRGSCRAYARLRERIRHYDTNSVGTPCSLPPAKPAVLPPPSQREASRLPFHEHISTQKSFYCQVYMLTHAAEISVNIQITNTKNSYAKRF